MDTSKQLRDHMRAQIDRATEEQLRLMYRFWVQISK